MLPRRLALQFCGFGGQGVVLSSVILGTAAVRQMGLYAVQTQSYGSEARGGECQAELILSRQPIGSPHADKIDILVAMSQSALDRYLPLLKSGGTLILVSDLVKRPERQDIVNVEIPALRIAQEVEATFVANMVVLGCLIKVSDVISLNGLLEAIRGLVPPSTIEPNLEAARKGFEWAAQNMSDGLE